MGSQQVLAHWRTSPVLTHVLLRDILPQHSEQVLRASLRAMFSPGFLALGTFHLGPEPPLLWSCPMHWKQLSSLPGLTYHRPVAPLKL
jgi:hypothetical protein